MEKYKKSSSNLKSIKPKKIHSLRTLRVFSRHPSHKNIKKSIKLPFLACMRLGSTTEGTLPYTVEINSIEAIKNSSNKKRMKTCFLKDNIKTAEWWIYNGTTFVKTTAIDSETQNIVTEEIEIPFPVVAKHKFGSRGQGNTLIKSKEEFDEWIKNKFLNNYIFEKYYNYTREYRLHVDSEGCFYTCRKMLKEDTPNEEKWHRHDSNCVWIKEDNELFDKPVNWTNIVEESVKALKSVGLDVGAIDLKIQSAKTKKNEIRENPDFIILEINSAPSFGDVTEAMYFKQIPIIAKRKHESLYKS